ncbi:hypothetical protein CL89_gp055 [Aeromonas phage PX29]|uniref:Uncharacterized protein n=1 Tax=Aeromonas phage PX29 TaxID=926067 RepID=E5DPY8_9CAUD|nr:hypothetical protein CL89_gp055 [Aeromonas phage PX29]ADQ52774.1 conserved hypothetical protein [Aeromonas phage PX29]
MATSKRNIEENIMKAAIEQMIREMNEFSENHYWNILIPDMKKRYDEDHVKCFMKQNLNRNVYGVEYGRKNARVYRADYNGSSRSVVWFVDLENGNIMKANGWKAASKYVRGNVSDWRSAMSQASAHGIFGFISCREGR